MFTVDSLNKKQKILKAYRFFTIYGFSRTYVKTIGRLRYDILLKVPISIFKKNKRNIAFIGCGQFAFATIGFFLKKKLGYCVYGAFDINENNVNSFVRYYGGKVFTDVEELIYDDTVEVVYIASNHFTHTKYAIQALNAGKVVYLEKPISVNHNQFYDLMQEYIKDKFFVGYNRPFSPAIKTICSLLDSTQRTPLTLNFFISGHQIPKGNWYRNPEEGTRVCGNIGHWIDLSVHILNKIGLPEKLMVYIQTSSQNEIDDNLNITFVSEKEDLITIVLASRTEPFEGINETVNLQYGTQIAKIDDFRKLTIWNSDKLIKRRYFRKDVGHKNAILQPFDKEKRRDFREIKISTLLMLEIKEAVLSSIKEFTFEINEANHTRP